MSIRLRLTLWYSGILAVTLLVFGIALYAFFNFKLHNDLRDELVIQAREVNKEIRGFGVFYSLPELREFKSAGIYLQSISTQGQIKRSSNLRSNLPYSEESINRVLQGGDGFETINVNQEYKLLMYYSPLVFEGSLVGVLQVATVLDDVEQFLYNLRLILIVIGLLTIFLAASAGWFLSRKALKPIENVIDAANAVEKSADLSKRIDYAGPMDEIGRLTDTINGMLTRIQGMYSELDDAYRAQRRFVSDASHELRTPLTTIRGNVDLLEKVWKSTALESGKEDGTGISVIRDGNVELSLEAMHDIASEAERMSRLVNDMLSLARADAGFTMSQEPVEMRPLVEEVIRRAQFLPRSAEWIAGDLAVLNDVYVQGNKDYLQQLLFILIENAFKYTEEGHVELDALQAGGQVGIRVSDTGIGMDKDEIPYIFERFYRADPSRGKKSGTGLGLSIAKWIIDAHGGSIEVKTQKEKGTTFIVWLPVLPSLSNPY
ncbi:HAMP domain-containing histidine kinase [Paenibacillus mesophilus]|uniref:sensor histidine kinase n=1 Tax=Paenibacillus mesophilus TaxID=2582849 RepID=UPI00110EC0CF|nr:HAMP domain-containing sensor histidine kinase [Paenibacillus mesophilus]TMV45433.1 HAMP domain-containing histidine kinase [Paenibacillus mesophilus]